MQPHASLEGDTSVQQSSTKHQALVAPVAFGLHAALHPRHLLISLLASPFGNMQHV